MSSHLDLRHGPIFGVVEKEVDIASHACSSGSSVHSAVLDAGLCARAHSWSAHNSDLCFPRQGICQRAAREVLCTAKSLPMSLFSSDLHAIITCLWLTMCCAQAVLKQRAAILALALMQVFEQTRCRLLCTS